MAAGGESTRRNTAIGPPWLVRFPFGWFALATALGEVPKVLIFVVLGAGLGEIPGWMGVAMGVSVVATLGAFLLLRRTEAELV